MIDNKLAASQLDIGESSNLAQIAQSYDYTFGEQIHKDAVCILSVAAQISIDSAKRMFDVDVGKEIRRLKKELQVKEIGYPSFWLVVRPDFNRNLINPAIHCPMNYLYNLKLDQFRSDTPTIDNKEFFIKHSLERNRRTCKKVEDMISKYSLMLADYNIASNGHMCAADFETNNETHILLHADFNGLVSDIQKQYVSSGYIGLFSWLIDRALRITPAISSNDSRIKSNLRKNRSLLLKTLYSVNRVCFLNCFQKMPENGDFGTHRFEDEPKIA